MKNSLDCLIGVLDKVKGVIDELSGSMIETLLEAYDNGVFSMDSKTSLAPLTYASENGIGDLITDKVRFLQKIEKGGYLDHCFGESYGAVGCCSCWSILNAIDILKEIDPKVLDKDHAKTLKLYLKAAPKLEKLLAGYKYPD